MLEMGIAPAEDINRAYVYGAAHPMDPFRLMDRTGIDVAYIMAGERFRKTGYFPDLPVPGIVEKYNQGRYGEKTCKS